MQNLEQEVTKALLYLERVQPDSALILEENLLKAQKNILNGIADTTDQKKIRTLVNQEMNLAFEGLDEEVIQDMQDIAGTTWDKMGSIMADGFVTDAAAKAFTKFKDIPKETKARLINKNMLIQGHTLEKHFKHLNSTSTSKIQGLIVDGFDKGQGIAEIGRNVRNSIGATYRNQANTIIRTSILENIEAVKNESWKEFEDEIDSYKFSAVMDTRTSKYCFLHNGYTTETIEKAKYRPKTHYNCRSVWIPQNDLIREFDKLNPDKRVVQWDGKKVNHRDGTKSTKFKVGEIKQVQKGSTPETFFKSFDEKYQREYLGAKRYELWKDGKMSFNEAMNVSRKKLLSKGVVADKLIVKSKAPSIKIEDKFSHMDKLKSEYATKIFNSSRDSRISKAVLKSDRLKDIKFNASENLYGVGGIHLHSRADRYTFIHEYGHHVDFIGISATKKFADAHTLDKKLFDSRTKLGKDNIAELVGIVNKPMIHKRNYLVSDILDSMTSGKAKDKFGIAGHGSNYYKINGEWGERSENFANLFAIYSDGASAEKILVKKYFPNTVKAFEEYLDDL